MKPFHFICILVFGVTACTAPAGYVKPERESLAPANLIPADVGLRISPEIGALTVVASSSTHTGSVWSYPLVIGPAISESLSNFVRSRFRNVATDSSGRGHGAVFFELVEFQPEIIEVGTASNISIRVATRLTMVDNAGHTVFSMVATGRGQRVANHGLMPDAGRFARGNPIVADLELATQRAVEDMLLKFAAAINGNIELRKAFPAR